MTGGRRRTSSPVAAPAVTSAEAAAAAEATVTSAGEPAAAEGTATAAGEPAAAVRPVFPAVRPGRLLAARQCLVSAAESAPEWVPPAAEPAPVRQE